MPKHGDRYRNQFGMEAQLTTPLTSGEEPGVAYWTYGFFVRIGGVVLAHVEPWVNIDDPNCGDYEDLFVFEDKDVAEERGDALLKTMGFVPV